MFLSIHEIRQINAALAREPAWKRALLESSVDAFREWLRRVVPKASRRISRSIDDVFLGQQRWGETVSGLRKGRTCPGPRR